jgi:hypothetical protein
MQKKWLYAFIFFSCVAGIAWVWWNDTRELVGMPAVCLFRKITGLPCPSCGTTHAVVHIMKLDFKDALNDNPIGFILVLGMIIFPFWILYDLVGNKDSFYRFYTNMESVVSRKWVAFPLLFLLLFNWVWNIFKYTS